MKKIFYIIFFINHFCINSLKFIKILMESDLAMPNSLDKNDKFHTIGFHKKMNTSF